jgi:hypothetical protein
MSAPMSAPMSDLVELELAARLHRAEDRWFDQCADRLRRASSPRSTTVERSADVTEQEVVR